MGLAASQARFLGLTARKSNVEYQVQQINQQRTALSNEVMGLFSDYNKLKVPTAPSINDFNKTVYNVDNTYEGYQIKNFTRIPDSEFYDVTLTYTKELAEQKPYTAYGATLNVKETAGDYSFINFQIGTTRYFYDVNDNKSNIIKITENYSKYPGLQELIKDNKLTGDTFYMFMKDDTPYYTSKDEIDATQFDIVEGEKVYQGDYLFYYQGKTTEEIDVFAKAAISQTGDGRLAAIQILSCDDDKNLVGHTYGITTTSTEDQQAYQEAMNDWAYKKDVYENECERINKKTQYLQEQDRGLELQINQLDTEQNALKTEMDSVKKVIEDTMDAVFKTFS